MIRRPYDPPGIGWLLAVVGLVVTIVLVLTSQLALLPLGVLFLLVFLAMLL